MLTHLIIAHGQEADVTELIRRVEFARSHEGDSFPLAYHEFVPMPVCYRFSTSSFGALGFVNGVALELPRSDARVTFEGSILQHDVFGALTPEDAIALGGFATPEEWMTANWGSVAEPIMVDFILTHGMELVGISFVTQDITPPAGVFAALKKQFSSMRFTFITWEPATGVLHAIFPDGESASAEWLIMNPEEAFDAFAAFTLPENVMNDPADKRQIA